ncbi:MAG: hypothetical protein CMM58_14095 [Rhodospirillaceae bacterium]|nr:hypothetical protein [Rhodospirillaceae bacterium]|tara:strand:+ start:3404 stop:4189 length:786 start_codon:yes stop_codon:yes gene_type:complete
MFYWVVILLITANSLALVGLYLVTRRMLKLRRQHKRSYTFKPYPIPKVKLNSVDPCFAAGPFGAVSESTVLFIGGEGVEASLSDRETWVVAALAKFSNRIFEFGTCSGKTTHVMALNAPAKALVYTITIHPEETEQLSFSKDDDYRHRERAAVEAKFDKFYYQGLETEKKIRQIFSDSKSFDETGLKESIDLVFIDGAHTRSYVESDSQKAFSMLTKSGVILWHDYKPDAPDVFEYLNELANELKLVHIENTDLVMYRRES